MNSPPLLNADGKLGVNANDPPPTKIKLCAWLLFLALGLGVEALLYAYRHEHGLETHKLNEARLAGWVARINGKLARVSSLADGLALHFSAPHAIPDGDGGRQELAAVLRENPLLRCLAVAEGAQVVLAYPANVGCPSLGHDLRTEPGLSVKLDPGITIKQPVLVWQEPASNGLRYYKPLLAGGQFLGVLIAGIDGLALFESAESNAVPPEWEYALRSTDQANRVGKALLGNDALFAQPDTLSASIDTPGGGQWRLSVKPAGKSGLPSPDTWAWGLRIFGWLCAAALSLMAATLWHWQRKMQGMALYDRVTGLPNRDLFLDRVKQVIRRTKRNRGQFSILCVDLTEFRAIDEQYGAKVGELALTDIGKRMLGFVRHCDTVTRWGGQAFLILLEDCPQEHAKIIADNLQHKISLPVYCGEQQQRVAASIGLATYPQDGQSLSVLLKTASAKMEQDRQRLGESASILA